MSKLLYVYENNMPTVSIMKKGVESVPEDDPYEYEFASVKDVKSDQLGSADAIVLIRPTEYMSYSIARWCSEANKYLVVFCDDDLYNGVQDSFISRRRVRYFRKTLALANLLWTCSPRIAEKYKAFTRGKRSMLTNTTIEPTDIHPHIGKNEKIKIVYAAGTSHKGLFECFISPIIQRLLDELGEVFTLTFVGVHPDVSIGGHDQDLINYVPLMPLDKYRAFMQSENFDIGVAPLNTDEFSKCKYFNKFFEYAMFGITGIYSETEPYTYIVKNKENGILVKNSPDNWYNSLKEAIEDDDLRRKCSLQSQQTLRERFYPRVNDDELRKNIPVSFDKLNEGALVGEVRIRCSRLVYLLENWFLYFITSLEHLVSNGPLALFKKVTNHIKDKKSYE